MKAAGGAGWRKVFTGGAASLTLGAAYVYTGWHEALLPAFPALCTAVVTVAGLVIAGNVGEHVAGAIGVKKATEAQP